MLATQTAGGSLMEPLDPLGRAKAGAGCFTAPGQIPGGRQGLLRVPRIKERRDGRRLISQSATKGRDA